MGVSSAGVNLSGGNSSTATALAASGSSTSIPTGSDLGNLISAVGLVTGTNASGTQTNSGGTVNSTQTNSGSTNSGTSDNTGTNNSTTNSSNSSGTTNTNNSTSSGTSGSNTSNSGASSSSTSTQGTSTTVNSGSTNITQNSGSTNTSQLDLTLADEQQLVNNTLSGSNGLASLLSNQHASGGYNTTTEQQLGDNLISQDTANVAALAAPTITKIGANSSIQQIGGSTSTITSDSNVVQQLINSSQSVNSGFNNTNVLGGSTSNTLGTSSSNTLGGTTSDTDTNQILGGSTVTGQTITPQTSVVTTGNIAPKINPTTAATLAVVGTGINALGGVSSIGNNIGNLFSSNAGGTGLSSIGSSTGLGTDALTLGGTALSSTVSSTGLGADALTLGSDTGDIVAASTAGDAAAAAGGGDILGDVLAAAAWIICTELNRQGKLPSKYYLLGAKYFRSYSLNILKGYYIWAVPTTLYIRKNPDSFYCKFMAYLFTNRAEYICALSGLKTARKTILGYISFISVHVFCWILSKTIAKNYNLITQEKREGVF